MATEEPVPPASPTRKAHTFACVRCSERKVKCDRQEPCVACVRHSAECIFKAPKPPRRRKNYSKEETVEQLKRYETLLRVNGIDPTLKDHPLGPHQTSEDSVKDGSPPMVSPQSVEQAISQMPTPASVSSDVRSSFKPQLLQGQNGMKFVDNSLWSRVAQEIRDGGVSLEDDSDSSHEGSDTEAPHPDFISVFSHASPVVAPTHPSPPEIRRLWTLFAENVNPIFKFIHNPTFSKALEKAIANIDRVPRGFEALMFSIYATAVISLPAEDCRDEFGASKTSLINRYVSATQNALLRAKFMGTTSLVVLQALLLHLVAIRESSEPRAVWNLTGLVIRIAEGMGMRIDGKKLGLPPFEVEMRRRLWWQLSVHDFRCAEMAGQAKFRSVDADKGAPEPPTNCDDSALWPGMTHAPENATGATEMLWVMFRTELSGFAKGQIARMKKAGIKDDVTPEEFLIMDDLDHKDRLVKQVEEVMETRYLRYCDPTQPLHLFTLLGTRGAIKLMKFMCHHPRRWAHLDHVPEEEVQLIWDLTNGILEYYHAMQTNPSIRRFKWTVSYFIQWHAVIHVLDTLRTTPMREGAEKAWTLIDSIYELNTHMMLSTHRPVFMAVGNLCLKAVESREQALEKEGRPKRDGPLMWINCASSVKQRKCGEKPLPQRKEEMASRCRSTNLRGLRTQHMATPPRLALREAWKLQATANEQSQHELHNPNPASWQAYNAHSVGSLMQQTSFDTGPWPDLASATAGQPQNFDQFNDNFLMNPGLQPSMSIDTEMQDASYFDADAILAQGYSLDTPNGQVVDWAQWDNFFGTTTGPTLGVGAASGVGWDMGPAHPGGGGHVG
ncbi:putative transcriptional regulatory protein [Cyphellophora attinorum]|uniref:Putative transcriptional regulatory protein n=1 Tax=Cyphellophora attinorum TaxID=1664694 RepID=A0A0N0NQT1_9EURO|nr:putative transcriptional regulatory protein [Phialophora attinorum]KPI44268.1 putative transcriptional regulatory protein [Phialophora attinorum]